MQLVERKHERLAHAGGLQRNFFLPNGDQVAANSLASREQQTHRPRLGFIRSREYDVLQATLLQTLLHVSFAKYEFLLCGIVGSHLGGPVGSIGL